MLGRHADAAAPRLSLLGRRRRQRRLQPGSRDPPRRRRDRRRYSPRLSRSRPEPSVASSGSDGLPTGLPGARLGLVLRPRHLRLLQCPVWAPGPAADGARPRGHEPADPRRERARRRERQRPRRRGEDLSVVARDLRRACLGAVGGAVPRRGNPRSVGESQVGLQPDRPQPGRSRELRRLEAALPRRRPLNARRPAPKREALRSEAISRAHWAAPALPRIVQG